MLVLNDSIESNDPFHGLWTFALQIFENVKKMISLNLPSILVPLVGLVFPAVAMASLFLYIEKEQLS